MSDVALFITWIGQACFLVEAGETTILMDPIPPKMGYSSGPVAADIVTVSHEHFDHNYVEMAKGAPVVLRGLSKEGKDWDTVDYSDKGVRITTFPTYHDHQKGAKRGKNSLFLIETKGLRILHTGDLGHPLSDETIKKIGKVDILMICVGGHYTIDAKEARAAVARLGPRVVIPMHYKTERTPKLPIAPIDEFLSGWENVVRSKQDRVGFTADLGRFPKDQSTVLVLPFRAK